MALKGPWERWETRLVLFALLLGTVFRLIWLSDMEYKSDEATVFHMARAIVETGQWPEFGMPSGVGMKNPPLSIWLFGAASWLFGLDHPVALCRWVALSAVIALWVLAWIVVKYFPESEKRVGLHGVALAAVNPFLVMYHRKIWTQSILPIFCVLFLFAWLKKKSFRGAFLLGAFGMILGQIHMSGFFFFAAAGIWLVLRGRATVSWKGLVSGMLLGAVPMLPWIGYAIGYVLQPGPKPVRMSLGWEEAIQLKFWVFWLTDAMGLHLGNALGVHQGNGALQQLADFLRYPLVGGRATYIVAGMHALLAGFAVFFTGRSLVLIFRRRFFVRKMPSTPVANLEKAAFWIYGALLTLPGIFVRRYYLLVTFPFEFVFMARSGSAFKRCWIAFLLLQAAMSAFFLYYVHVNGGSVAGDYGKAFRLQAAPG